MDEAALRRATALQAAGRWAEAETAWAEVLAAAPDFADGWDDLGWALRRQGRWADALTAWDEALKHGASEPWRVRLNRAVAFADGLLRPAEAQAELEAALADEPGCLPAWLNLGNLHEDRGRRAEAQAAYRRALDLAPDHPTALARLGQVAPVEGADDPLTRRLARARDSAALARDPESRAEIGFSLGRRLDEAGAWAQAFEAYVRANADSRAAGGGVRWDAAAAERRLSRVLAAFPAAGPARPIPQRRRAPPVFVCGMVRSGSTLVEQVLAAHPRVTPGGELDLIPGLVTRELAPFPDRMPWIDAARLDALAEGVLTRLHALFPDADVITDKRPDNVESVGLIKALFPEAKIVITRRDPLDNGLSAFFLHLDRSMPWALDLHDVGRRIAQTRRLEDHWAALWPKDVLVFDYDAFVREPQANLARLLAFLELEPHPGCLEFHRLDNAVKTASVWQVRRPLHRGASGRAANYAPWLGPLRDGLGALAESAA